MKQKIIITLGFIICTAFTVNLASAGMAIGEGGKSHPFGSDTWHHGISHEPALGHGPAVQVVQPQHYLAAKRFCLMHVDRFVTAVKANEEDHVRLANLCSRGYFHNVWKLTGGEEPKLTHNGYESVHEWEKGIREAAERLADHGVPSEAWRKHLMGLSKK